MIKHEKNFFSNFFKKNCKDIVDNSTVDSIFCIYDSKAQKCLEPFVAPSVEFAKRSIISVFKNPNPSILKDFSSDFILYKIGTYNSFNGMICPDFLSICSLSEFDCFNASKTFDPNSLLPDIPVSSVELFPTGDENE